MNLFPAKLSDSPDAASCLAAAFAADPLLSHFFADHPRGRHSASERFFSLLLRARITLEMPVLLAGEPGHISGAVMGYTTKHPAWPAALEREWEEMEASAPELKARFAAYERLSRAHLPAEPHYYLGVLGVAPEAKGTGLGAALLRAFCALSASDPLSNGVYLETANEQNLPFYRHHGFDPVGSDVLGSGSLWCLFHRHQR